MTKQFWDDFDPAVLLGFAENANVFEDALASLDHSVDLPTFRQGAWPVLEPGRRLMGGWAIDAMDEHLTACATRAIKRLIINVPPGMMKSLNTRVFFPAWRWTTNPEDRFLGASYSHRLAVRDNRRCRLLIQSPWFQRHWGDRCRLMEDSTSKERFENTRAGFMYATTIGGTTTGERGNFLIIDDPNNVKTAESEATREEALFWFAEVAPSRLIDQEEDVIIVIQQRVHEQDVTGFALEADLGYEHLCIPMEFESGNPRNPTCIGWVDPRTEENELCFPEMFPRDAVERLKKQLRSWGGDYAVAGQLQQRPAPRGGGLFKKEKVGILEETPPGCRWVRGWDLAATKDGGAYTAGARVGIDPMGRIILDDMFRSQIDADSVEQAIQDYANQDGYDCKVSIPQDPGQSGKGQVASMARRLQGFDVEFSPESGSKADRARPLASQVNAGNFYIVRGDWNRAFMNELGSFPVGRFQDQIDACTRAYSLLLKSDITSKVSFGGDARESVWDF